jgi:hypothetical protein
MMSGNECAGNNDRVSVYAVERISATTVSDQVKCCFLILQGLMIR